MSNSNTPYFFRSPGSGSSTGTGTGAKNYVLNTNFENSTTNNWSLANSTITSKLPVTVGSGSNSFSSAGGVHGGGAANANLSISAVTSGKLAGSYSLSYVSSAATTLGDMLISDAFTIDIEDQAKVMTIKFYYSATSGTANCNFSGTSSNSFAVFIYDVTNNAWIQPAGVYNLIQGTGVGYMTGTFQTTSNSTQYQIAVVNLTATSGAATILFDDFFVGPQTAPMGPAMTDWVSYTPTGTWSTNTTYTGWWKREGDKLSLIVKLALAGAPTSATLSVNLPSGLVIDTTKLPATPTLVAFPSQLYGQGAAHNFGGQVLYSTTTSVLPVFIQDGSTASIMNYVAITQAAPYTFANADYIYFTVTGIPIVGWSSNTNMSSDTDTRVVAMAATAPNASLNYNAGTPNSTVPTSAGEIVYATSVSDTHGAYNATTGAYTIPVTGFHNITAQYVATATTTHINDTFGIQLFNATTSTILYANTVIYDAASTSGKIVTLSVPSVYLTAGTQIYIRGLNSGSTTPVYVNSPTANYFMVNRISGPAVVQATESVGAAFVDAAGVTLTSTYTTYAYANKLFDTHSAYGVSGYYITPVTGVYELNAAFGTQPSNIAGSTWGINIAAFCGSTQFAGGWAPGTGSSMTLFASCDGQIRCTAGQTLYIQLKAAANTIGYTGYGPNTFTIKRIGN